MRERAKHSVLARARDAGRAGARAKQSRCRAEMKGGVLFEIPLGGSRREVLSLWRLNGAALVGDVLNWHHPSNVSIGSYI